jgi:PAS domain S-box-containing protein
MITARSDNSSVDQAFEVGATDYIIKPIHYGVVRQRVRRLFEAKRTGEALRQCEQLYRAVVEEQTELLCRWGPDGKLTFVNEPFCRHFGGPREKLYGVEFHLVFSETDREVVKAHINEMKSQLKLTNPTVTKEFPIRGQSGKTYWIQWTNRAIFDDDDNLVEYQTVGQDITELKQAEEALREKTAELQAVFKVIPDLFFRLEPTGLILNAYAGSASNFYLPPKEFIGKNVIEVLPPESASIMQDGVTRVHRTNMPQTEEYVLPLEQEEQIYEARLWPFQETEVIALVRNITERKQMEARMLNSQKLADLGTLAAGAADEINSPLQVITGTAYPVSVSNRTN